MEFTKTTSELTGKFKYSEDGTKIRLDVFGKMKVSQKVSKKLAPQMA